MRPMSPAQIQRFWSFVVRAESGCWLWAGPSSGHGYGAISLYGVACRAHRVSFMLHHGRWPSKFVLHRCDVPACVNPAHLFEGTQAENLADMRAKGRYRKPPRLTHCQRGHEMTEANIYRSWSIGREMRNCKTCRRENRKFHRTNRHMVKGQENDTQPDPR